MSTRYLNATAHPEGREPSLVLDVQGFDYDRSQHSNGTTLVVKGVTARDLRGLISQLQIAADVLENGTDAHLTGWAPGNLQHHLVFGHGIAPSDAPYDGPLDKMHRQQHASASAVPES